MAYLDQMFTGGGTYGAKTPMYGAADPTQRFTRMGGSTPSSSPVGEYQAQTPQVSYGPGQAPGTASSAIQYGTKLDPKYMTENKVWNENTQGWDYRNPTWNTQGLDFGQAPEAGATPMIEADGTFSGWMGPSGGWTQSKNISGTDAGGNAWTLPTTGQSGDWTAHSGGETAGRTSDVSKYGSMTALGLIGGMAGAGALGAAGLGPLAGMGGAGAEAGLGAGAGLTSLGEGAVPALTSASTIAEPGMVAGLGGSSFSDLLKQYGPKVAGALTQGGAGGSKAGSGGNSALQTLINLFGGAYSAHQAKDYAGNLKDMYSGALGRQDPYNQLLLQSYQDPNSFYNSNQWKGLESVYQNNIDRQAAKGGTSANPTQREVLLNNYAMKELENYRSGLRGDVTAYDPSKYADPYAKGLQAEQWANSPIFGAIGNARGTQGASGGGADEILNLIKSGAGTVEDIGKWLSQYFSGS